MNAILKGPVLIVGAGPVGLTLAIELGFRGIPCVVVEKRDGRVPVPKMSGVTPRGMEFCRRWKIADRVRAAGIPQDHSGDIVYVSNLRNQELGRWKIPAAAARSARSYTPEPPCKCAQIFFDPILVDLAKTFPSLDMRYNTALESFRETDDGVVAQLISMTTGKKEPIRASYLVGCDGPNGIVREALDIEIDGLGVVAHSVSIFFRSTGLSSLHDKGWAHVYRFVDASGCWSELIPVDGKELWRLSLFDDPEGVRTAEDRLRKAVGMEFDYEILSVLPWERRDHVASCYGRGRAFIVGDAAHECSPTGGLGMHTGLEESVNLAWKLAAVVQGWGGAGLLSSYEAERRPIALRNVKLATQSFHAISAIPGYSAHDSPGQKQWQARLHENLSEHLVGEYLKMQYCYEESPICISDGTRAPLEDRLSYSPSARPGTRAPHLWLADGSSILDHFGFGFTLLRLGENAPVGRALIDAARRGGVSIEQVTVPDEEAESLYESKLVLVRPDGHVAWRGSKEPSAPEAVINRVRGAAPTMP